MWIMKATLICCFVLVQLTLADIYSQLQFIKITSPTNGQSIEAGSQLNVSYIMQPSVLSKFGPSLSSLILFYFAHIFTF